MKTSAIIISALVLHLSCAAVAVEFKWSTLQLDGCVANDTSRGLCAKSMRVECVKKVSNELIPEYYCREGSQKPLTRVRCDVKKCKGRCVVAMWSAWHPCDPACTLPFMYRTRQVLWKDGTVVCPALIEKSSCAHCSKSSHNDIFFWQVGQWGSCRRFATIIVDQLAAKTLDAMPFCGSVLTLGKSTRKVRCVDVKGQEVRARKCLNGKDKYGRITQRPDKNTVCSLPCDCRVSDWGEWSGCAKDCHVTEERRTRDVMYAAQLGGKGCGLLEETRACVTNRCPHYEWYATPWHACQTQPFPGNSICGHGFHERLIFCIKSSKNKSINELQPVQDDLCDPKMKLVARKPCHTPCRQDCKVGEWQAWEPCPVKCGKAGVKKRRRNIIQAASHGGKDCPNLIELSRCDHVQCNSWDAKQWSRCFVTAQCGLSAGIRVRLVYCTGVGGILLLGSPKNCSHLVKPAAKEICSKPCPNDCAVSHWGNWGPCSKSCGIQGGVRTRHKRILGYPSAGSTPCPTTEKLMETRMCNRYKFCDGQMNFMWKMGDWSVCTSLSKGRCGNLTGMKKRSVHCGTMMQNLGNKSFCPQELKPAVVQPCDVACPKDCILSKWQEWSVCSKTCGSTGIEVRKRYILQEAFHGGKPCPLNMTDGVQIGSRPCTTKMPCYFYRWATSEWAKCTLIPQTKTTQIRCGAGYETRNISCLRSDEKLVAASYCYQSLFTTAPKALRECWIPCRDYCVRSSWSAWSSCTNSCTINSPSFRQRTRRVVNLSPARGGWSTTCPQLTALDYSEREACRAISCFTYKWHKGPWRSCVLDGVSCGNGGKERAVLCQRSDGLFVSETYCSNTTKPSLSENCSVSCSQDCMVSSWGTWSNCSNTCGDTIQTRHQTIVKPSVGLGRLCPSLTEKRLCHGTPCSSFQWSAELWSTCELSTNHTCGNGTQTRNVTCFPDPASEFVCMKQTPKPVSTQPCELPCPGDCVLSNWGDWSFCVKGRSGCIQKRWRMVIRKALDTSQRKCGNKPLREEQSCNCPTAGKLVMSEWSTCQLNHTSEPNCGKGQQFRSVKCMGEKDKILSDKYCAGINTAVRLQDCHVKCPVDCVVDKWGPWSLCSKTCGIDGMVMRSRKIIVVGKNGGRRCLDKTSLKQKRPCNAEPCYKYMLKKGKWSKCYVDGQGCGYGLQTRDTWCERSDGQSVQSYYCFGQLRSANDAVFKDLSILQAVLNYTSTLSILTKKKCEVVCPGNCILSQWSDWSTCGRSCFVNTKQSFQTRTRVTIVKPVTGGKACSTELQQNQTCHLQGNTKCIGAKWNTGSWQQNGTREVWCETSNGLKVSGACIFNDKPSTSKHCDPTCSDPNAVCKDGKCLCKSHFEFFQNQCIPVKGCLHNGHCIFENTICKEQECKCKVGHARNKTTGPCVQLHGLVLPSITTKREWPTTKPRSTSTKPNFTSTKPSSTSIRPSSTSTVTDEVDKKAFAKKPFEKDEIPQGYWKWIGIGAGALAFMILLVIGVVCYTRRPKKSNMKQDGKSKNSIELIGMLTITDGNVQKPVKV